MAPARAWSVALRGVDGELVEIEAHIGNGLPAVQLIGLPDAALHESRDRVRAAVVNSGEGWPGRRVTLALSPAMLPKGGSGYDLALACCVLAAAGAVPQAPLHGTVLLGELALDGRLRPVRGVLPCMVAARQAGIRRAVVPVATLAEAALVTGLTVYGASHLDQVLEWLRGESAGLVRPGPSRAVEAEPVPDLADVLGQRDARQAIEIAAAGGHNLLLTGPPGSGKTMLARRMVGLLPELSIEEALQVTMIRSVVGLLRSDTPLSTTPPFVAPHHTTSVAALVGGGTGLARPGAISLAHRGLLFLDEAPEFGPRLLDALRTPLEDGEVRLARRDGVVRYPARVQLVLAANPCPCAPARDVDCVCPTVVRRRYLGRLSGPLLDRVDLRVELEPSSSLCWADPHGVEDTATVRGRVLRARAAATERCASYGWRTNAEVPGPALRTLFRLPRAVTVELDRALRSGAATARGVDRCLRVAWTLSDLAGLDRPDAGTVHTALTFKHRRAA